MQIHSITKIGSFHTNHNEDFITVNQIATDKYLLAIMDGCSMGKESHFAAALCGKILRKSATEFFYKSFHEKTESNLSNDLKNIVKQLFEDLKFHKNKLLLETEELLCTLFMALVDVKNKKAEILCIGDGLICNDKTLYEYEQDNKPDYLGYHLDEFFEEWYEKQDQRLSLKHISDLSIASDGIFTFKKFNNKNYPDFDAKNNAISESPIIDFLLRDRIETEGTNLLKKKVFEIEQDWGLKPSDDLSIIRIMLD